MRLLHVARYLAGDDALRPADQRTELHTHALRTGISDDDIVASRYLHRMTVVGAVTTAAASHRRIHGKWVWIVVINAGQKHSSAKTPRAAS